MKIIGIRLDSFNRPETGDYILRSYGVPGYTQITDELRGAMKRSVTRWQAQQIVAEYMRALRQAKADVAHVPDPITGEIGLKPDTLEQDWRGDARSAGLTPEEVEESWQWFRCFAFEAPPIMEDADQRAWRETMPESVRLILSQNPLYGFVGYDPDLLDDLGLSIVNDAESEEEDQPFWEDIGYALGEPSDADTRHALDRIGRLVRLQPRQLRALAEQDDTSMAAVKRRLIQEAVLLSLGAAEERIRIGRRTVKDDPAHPIKLEEVFGTDGLRYILEAVIRETQQSADDAREQVERSLSGPFRPMHLTDREVYREWFTKEIKLRTEKLLGEDLDTTDVGRLGGARRNEVSYDESEPLPEIAQGSIGRETRIITDQDMREAADREEKERASFRTAAYHTQRLTASERKNRMEDAHAARIDFQRTLHQIVGQYDAPLLRQYADCVLETPLLMDDDQAAADQLGWPRNRVRDIKHRLKSHMARIAAEQQWKAQFPKGL
jgi:hypothetical protein